MTLLAPNKVESAPFTKDDLHFVRGVAYTITTRRRIEYLAEEVISYSLLRFSKLEVPANPKHRAGFIVQTVKWAITDVIRQESPSSRRSLERLKRGEQLTRTQRSKIISVAHVDFREDTWKAIPAETKPELPDVRWLLATIGLEEPVLFFVLTMLYIHDCTLAQVGSLLGQTEGRAQQLKVMGLRLLRLRYRKHCDAM